MAEGGRQTADGGRQAADGGQQMTVGCPPSNCDERGVRDTALVAWGLMCFFSLSLVQLNCHVDLMPNSLLNHHTVRRPPSSVTPHAPACATRTRSSFIVSLV